MALYNLSRSKDYCNYFASDESVLKGKSIYSMTTRKLVSGKHPFGMNLSMSLKWAGIPLALSNDDQTVYTDQTDAHTLVIGPTGSKKSRLVAMPTVALLGAAKESMIVSDPKGEIYRRCSAQLIEHGYFIQVVNFRQPDRGMRWNPLSIPYRYYCEGNIDKASEFASDVSINLTRTIEGTDKDPFWESSAASLLFGLIMLLFKYCKDRDLPASNVNLSNIIRLREAMFIGTRSQIQNSALWKYAKQDAFIAANLIGTIGTADETRSSILSVFDDAVHHFSQQPNLSAMLSDNEITLDVIVDRPTAIFLILPDEKTTYHKLVSLFIKQSYEYLIQMAQGLSNINSINEGILERRLNFVLDEFSALPTINDFPAMITAARSRNIRFMLFVQSKHQLQRRYSEEAETIQSNCSNWIFLFSREVKLLEELSSLCGNMTDERHSPVLSISALQHLDKQAGEALILHDRLKPYITHLADIDQYISPSFIPHVIEIRSLSSLPPIDFINGIKDSEDIDYGYATKEIDGRIEELKKNAVADAAEERCLTGNVMEEANNLQTEDEKSKLDREELNHRNRSGTFAELFGLKFSDKGEK